MYIHLETDERDCVIHAISAHIGSSVLARCNVRRTAQGVYQLTIVIAEEPQSLPKGSLDSEQAFAAGNLLHSRKSDSAETARQPMP